MLVRGNGCDVKLRSWLPEVTIELSVVQVGVVTPLSWLHTNIATWSGPGLFDWIVFPSRLSSVSYNQCVVSMYHPGGCYTLLVDWALHTL